ncbi:hypothetical protein N7456_000134 [Penicillium angulare]|uniref:SnoaL-like domain-containing protein n=1 Tax=Penicillium angulare TaxID=116970 RepID=A0A9W9KS07_9EURO|nr:hypothetical protein N7456_000134 [Penicillium angulare]
MTTDHNARLLAEFEIKSLLVRERFYRDTCQWQNLRDSYHPDSSQTSIKITWFAGDIDGFVAGSKKMSAGGTNATHTICPIEIHLNDERAVSVSTGSISIRFLHEDAEYDCISYTRFVSRLQRIGSEWKMLTLEAIYERDTITPVIPSTSAAIFALEGARPSYRCISWCLQRTGCQIDHELPGQDRPDLVAGMMEDASVWLGKEE